MTKHEDHKCHMGTGIIAALFGVFFLISNLVPDSGMIMYWPIFLIAFGAWKAYSAMNCCCTKKPTRK